MSGIGDTVIPLRTETVHNVLPAVSLNNLFKDVKELPHNPGLAENNYNSGHQDSYCSESVGLTGPNSNKLRLIVQHNPYGFTPLMTCNRHNQMVAVSVGLGLIRLIVFNSECEILSATLVGVLKDIHSFAGGYFFLNNDDNAVVVSDNKLACFPTAHVRKHDEVYSLDAKWTSDNLVKLITERCQVTATDEDNKLYIGMPVWQTEDPNPLFWVLLAGKYDFETSTLISSAYAAVVQITPDSSKHNHCQTEVIDCKELKGQWNNNTIAVSPQGVFFVTNGCDETGACTGGYLYSIGFDATAGKMEINWKKPYKNSGFLKPGQRNIGSGTTPTLFDGTDGTEYVAITDNAYPQMNVVIYQRGDGTLVSEVPVMPKMRGCDEASLIGVQGRVIVENNFGHIVNFPHSQYVANEPGIALIQVEKECEQASEVIWNNDHLNVFGMSQLARKSGVIFGNTGDWNVADATSKGALYSISAIDSWDGREIWRIPLGQGREYCRDYGGVYFNRTDSDNGKGTSIFIGTETFLVSVQNYDESAISIRDEVKKVISK
jgi:hypothetical protein